MSKADKGNRLKTIVTDSREFEFTGPDGLPAAGVMYMVILYAEESPNNPAVGVVDFELESDISTHEYCEFIKQPKTLVQAYTSSGYLVRSGLELMERLTDPKSSKNTIYLQ